MPWHQFVHRDPMPGRQVADRGRIQAGHGEPAIAFWPARVADRKGHSFFGYFLLSLVFFPLALIMAYMVRDRRATA